VITKIIKYPEKIQILRMIFMKLYPLKMGRQADIAAHLRKWEVHENTLVK